MKYPNANNLAAWLTLAMILALTGCTKVKPPGTPLVLATNAVDVAGTTNGPVTVKVKWLAGKTYHLRMESLQSWETVSPPQEPSARPTLGITHDYAISVLKELADGGQELQLEFVAQKMFYQIGEVPMMSFDSAQSAAQDAGNPVATVLRQLTGAKLRCTTDARGRMTKVDGFTELQERMAGGNSQVKAMLEQFFNEVNLRQMFSCATGLSADDPVHEGDTWPVHLETPDPLGLMVIDGNCTLKGWEPQGDRHCVRVEYLGSVSSQPDPNGSANPSKITAGTVSGKAWVDPALGMLVNCATEQHLDLETTAHGKTTTSKYHLTLNFRLLKVDEDRF